MNNQEISKLIKSISLEEINIEIEKLKHVDLDKISQFTRIGNNIVDYFTFTERLNTITIKKLSFFDFYKNRNLFLSKSYIQNFILNDKKRNYTEIQSLFNVFRIYFNLPSSFKPINAMKLYNLFKPTTILDPTAGWGGRMVAASVLNINYIGMDSNPELVQPLTEMKSFLQESSSSEINLFFQDCLTFDYSILDYDMVFTSPPYFNIEMYTGMKSKTKFEWIVDFYTPLIQKTYKHLKPMGVYCLNVNIEIYEKACIPLLGECCQKIPLVQIKRRPNQEYKEYIYIWIKT
jgi:DNA modification methylase